MRSICSGACILAVLACASISRAQSLRPPDVEVRVVRGTAPNSANLAVVKNGGALGSIPMRADITNRAVDAGLEAALWHPNGRDVALGFTGPASSFVVIFLRQVNDSYLAIDVSNVEKVNIGGIGPHRAYKERQTAPIEWLPLSRIDALGSRFHGTEAVQIRLRTRAWDESGRRYSVAEPLIVTRDGTPLWR